jgi:hypothetical protein
MRRRVSLKRGWVSRLLGEDPMALFIKWVLVLALLCGGTLFLAHGIGIETPLDKYEVSSASAVPVGVGILLAGFALAAFWKIETHTSGFDNENSIDGSLSGPRKIIKVERRFDKLQ